jgi:PAS domain S-box-containing protein
MINNEPHILSVNSDISLRKKNEDNIRVSENRFRQIAENAEELIWEIDNKGLITFCNDIVFKILGYTTEEVVNKKHFYDFFESVKREERKAKGMGILNRKENLIGSINNYIHKDGHIVIIETNGSPIIDEQGQLKGYRGTNTDITQRVNADKALRESEEKYRLLAVNSSDVIWTLDLEGNITYISPSVKQFRGYTPEEVMQMGIEKFLAPASAEVAKGAMAEYLPILKSGQQDLTRTFIFELVCKDGSTVWAEVTASTMFNDNHEVIGVVGITRDVTDRLLMEEKLKNSEEIFRSLAEYSPNMIFIVIKKQDLLCKSDL